MGDSYRQEVRKSLARVPGREKGYGKSVREILHAAGEPLWWRNDKRAKTKERARRKAAAGTQLTIW